MGMDFIFEIPFFGSSEDFKNPKKFPDNQFSSNHDFRTIDIRAIDIFGQSLLRCFWPKRVFRLK